MTIKQFLMLLARQSISEDAEMLVNYPCALHDSREHGEIESLEADADGNISIWVEPV